MTDDASTYQPTVRRQASNKDLEITVCESNLDFTIPKSASEPQLSSKRSKARRGYLSKKSTRRSSSSPSPSLHHLTGSTSSSPVNQLSEPTPYEAAITAALSSELKLPPLKVWAYKPVHGGAWSITTGPISDFEMPQMFPGSPRRAEGCEPAGSMLVQPFLIRSEMTAVIGAAKEDADQGLDDMSREKSNLRKVHLCRKPRLCDQYPAAWHLPPLEAAAASDWDKRYRQACAVADKCCYNVSKNEGSPSRMMAFKKAVFDVRVTRYHPPSQAQKDRLNAKLNGTAQKEAPKAQFDVTKSIWAPRIDWADSGSLFDSDEVQLQRFKADWSRAKALGIVKTIIAYDDDAAIDEDGDGVLDEIQEVETILWQNYETYAAIFSYFASGMGVPHMMNRAEWAEFLSFFHLIQKNSRFCKQKDMDALFFAVDNSWAHLEDGEEKRLARQKTYSMKYDEAATEFNRVEFLMALVRVAINRYVRPKIMVDVSEALQRLLDVDIETHFNQKLLAHPNVFRRTHAYAEATCEVLSRHETTLRSLFTALSWSDADVAIEEKSLLSVDEWKEALKALGFFDVDFNERMATLSFIWSRMVVVDGGSKWGHRKETHLPFEGFLEAICRVSAIKALPTDKQVTESGHQNAGIFLQKLQAQDPAEYRFFMNEHSRQWGAEPAQPFHRCVDHLLFVIIEKVKAELLDKSSGKLKGIATDPGVLTQAEVDAWAMECLPVVRVGCEEREKAAQREARQRAQKKAPAT